MTKSPEIVCIDIMELENKSFKENGMLHRKEAKRHRKKRLML